MAILKIIIVICFITIVLIYISRWVGKESAFTFAMQFIPPICVILFYMSSKFSIIEPIMSVLNITNEKITENLSIKVAVDSAIVTILLNSFFRVFASPVVVTIHARSLDNLDLITLKDKPLGRTSGNQGKKIRFTINVNFRTKMLRTLFDKYVDLKVRIKNTDWTNIQIENEQDYGEIVNSDNSSKYIDINLCKISNKKKKNENIYPVLLVSAKKFVDRDDEIECELVGDGRGFKYINKLLCEMQYKPVKVVYRETKDD